MNTAARILTEPEAKRIANDCHKQCVPLVFTNGCFDYLHRGHVHLLETAAEYGPVFVGVNSDESVRMLKGPTRPINSERDRVAVVAALACVKAVFIVHSPRVADAIRMLQPAYWVKGGDYSMDTLDKTEVEAANDVGSEIILVPTLKGYSTTNIIKKL